MKKILVVDDSEIVRSITLELLIHQGFATLSADNGLNGLEVARRDLPDLILCDVIMPELDGYGLLAELRADVTTASIPFVFLSGNSPSRTASGSNTLAADAYLIKPFTYNELRGVINNFITS